MESTAQIITHILLLRPSAHPNNKEVIATFFNIRLYNLPLSVNGRIILIGPLKPEKNCQNLAETFGQDKEDYNTMEP